MSHTANMVGIARTRYVGITGSSKEVLSNLQIQMKDDLDNVFFNTNEFAEKESIQYIHSKSGVTRIYEAIFDNPSQDVKAGSQTEILGIKPQVQIPSWLMEHQPILNDVLIVKGIRYNIDSYEDDGVGVVTIYLVREGQNIN